METKLRSANRTVSLICMIEQVRKDSRSVRDGYRTQVRGSSSQGFAAGSRRFTAVLRRYLRMGIVAPPMGCGECAFQPGACSHGPFSNGQRCFHAPTTLGGTPPTAPVRAPQARCENMAHASWHMGTWALGLVKPWAWPAAWDIASDVPSTSPTGPL